MRSKIALFGVLSLFAVQVAAPASAAVSVTVQPTSLVTSPTFLRASSGQLGLFSFNLTQTAGETLSSVTIAIANAGSSTATGGDLASVQVYKDNGDGVFDTASDLLAGSQAAVNIGSPTTVATPLNNAIDGGEFFVSLATAASWSSATAPGDSITVTLPTGGIATSADSPAVTAATTAAITADTVGPQLVSAVAKNTGGTAALEAGDSLELTFNEPTNKPVFTPTTLGSTFVLSHGHALLDGAGTIGSAAWNGAGTQLTIVFSANASLPTVTLGDTVMVQGSVLKDVSGNVATGSRRLSGTFGSTVLPTPRQGRACANGLVNGKLYRIPGSNAVYLAAACSLKLFRGAAVGKAWGKKFRDIITLTSIDNINVRSSAFRDNRGERLEHDGNRGKQRGHDDDEDEDDNGPGNRGSGRGQGRGRNR